MRPYAYLTVDGRAALIRIAAVLSGDDALKVEHARYRADPSISGPPDGLLAVCLSLLLLKPRSGAPDTLNKVAEAFPDFWKFVNSPQRLDALTTLDAVTDWANWLLGLEHRRLTRFGDTAIVRLVPLSVANREAAKLKQAMAHAGKKYALSVDVAIDRIRNH